MGKEVLYIQEEDLKEVIDVIRAGLVSVKVSNDVWVGLSEWCDEEEEYLSRLTSEEAP